MYFEKKYSSFHDYYDDLEDEYFRRIEEADREYEEMWVIQNHPQPLIEDEELPF